MFKQVLILLGLISLLACNGMSPTSRVEPHDVIIRYTGDALPQNTSITTREDSICGQVTNINVQGGVAGPQGDRGEMGPAGPQGLRGLPGTSGGGVSYTCWGRTTCPTTQGTELVYEGVMAGSKYNEAGSSNYLCLHDEPQNLQVTPGVQSNHRGYLYGTEYETRETPPAFGGMYGHNAPCSVCYTSGRSTTITIPGRTSCPYTWTTEYYGYLMAENSHPNHRGSRVPVCVDVNAESIQGSAPRTATSLLYFMEVRCAGICPPYSDGQEIACAVCTI